MSALVLIFFIDNILQLLYTLTVLIVLIQLRKEHDNDFDRPQGQTPDL